MGPISPVVTAAPIKFLTANSLLVSPSAQEGVTVAGHLIELEMGERSGTGES